MCLKAPSPCVSGCEVCLTLLSLSEPLCEMPCVCPRKYLQVAHCLMHNQRQPVTTAVKPNKLMSKQPHTEERFTEFPQTVSKYNTDANSLTRQTPVRSKGNGTCHFQTFSHWSLRSCRYISIFPGRLLFVKIDTGASKGTLLGVCGVAHYTASDWHYKDFQQFLKGTKGLVTYPSTSL